LAFCSFRIRAFYNKGLICGSRASLKIEDFVFVPPVVSYGKNIIGMVTLNGTLCTVQHRYEKS